MRLCLALLSALLPPAATAAAPLGHPVLVELFTSQGCSSCPPADAVVVKLANDPRVVAITRPVTYWDQLGWKDTLAKPVNTGLQRAYARRGFGGGGVYTPQIVVQGRAGVVGSNSGKVNGLIAQGAALPEPGLAIAALASGGRSIALSGKGSGEVVLVAMRRAVDVAIGRGENGGRRVRYANVLVGERVIGTWTGGAGRFAIPPAALRIAGADRYAVLVRQPDAGPVLAARYL